MKTPSITIVEFQLKSVALNLRWGLKLSAFTKGVVDLSASLKPNQKVQQFLRNSANDISVTECSCKVYIKTVHVQFLSYILYSVFIFCFHLFVMWSCVLLCSAGPEVTHESPRV